MEAINELSEIQKFYHNTSIFVTGGTGFLGKVLLEKLLRSCPTLDTIYVLVRQKKGQNAESRMDQVFEEPLYNRLAQEQPKFRHKVQIIDGDCALPGLGLSLEDRQKLTEKVNIVFHGAATVRFDEKLRLATAINVQGCKELMTLCQEMKKLKSLVHISTAYAQCIKDYIEEKFYLPGMHYKKLISIVERTTDDEELEKATMSLIAPWPNTYAYTKAVAEQIVGEESGNMAVGIFRPSIVISSYKEPMNGWIDNLYGAMGVCTGAGLGILHTLHCDPGAIANIIPVDTTVNALISTAWEVAKKHELNDKGVNIIPIYNYVSTRDNSLNWDRFMYLCSSNGIKYPSIKSMWYYSLMLNKYWLVHWLCVIFLHLLPGALTDLVLIATGNKPRMLKIHKHIIRYSDAIAHFCCNTWNFQYDNVLKMWDNLDRKDRDIFFFDMRSVDWNIYFKEHMLGVRRYFLKESDDTLPDAKIKWRIFYCAHQLLRIAFYYVVLRLVWYFLGLLFV